MSATESDSCTVGDTPIQTSSELVVCKYGTGTETGTGDAMVQVQVPKEILMQFRIFRDINNDVPTEDNSFYADIPIINDNTRMPVYFNKDELTLFFELSVKELEDIDITSELLIRFILLANFLDYDIYLHTLCKYAASFMIKGTMFT